MHIGIDGNEANIERRVGIGEYAYEIIHQLAKFQDKHTFTVFLKEKPREDLPCETDKFRYVSFGPLPFWTQLAFPIRLYLTPKLDLVFSPTHYAPRFSPVPSVVSIMDLSYIRYPQLFKKSDLFKLKKWTLRSVRKAKSIFTISNFSKSEIVSYYKVNPEIIYVTYPGYKENIYHQSYPKSQIEEVKKKYNLSDYLIFVGTIQPRKNISRLIEAFLKLQKDFPTFKLILIGKKGWLYQDIFNKIRLLSLKDRLVYLGYLEDTEIAKLYSGANSFILPSLYEGFGMPVVEAMACGCPVIVSNTSSLPEIAASAAVYINPESTQSISEGLVKLMRPDQKYFRENLIEKGLQRVKNFSWERCGRETMTVLEGVV